MERNYVTLTNEQCLFQEFFRGIAPPPKKTYNRLPDCVAFIWCVYFSAQSRCVIADLHHAIETLLTILHDDYDITSKQ